jgi:hypothetical protein
MGKFPVARFVERRQVVAIVPAPQRDDPPGRGEVREREAVIAQSERPLPDVDLPRITRSINTGEWTT